MTSNTAIHRVFNFSAGPAVMPVSGARGDPARSAGAARRRHVDSRDQPPIEDVRGDPRAGRGRHPHAGGGSRQLRVLFLQGGASLQFSMVPMNLLGAGRDRRLHRQRVVGRQGDQGSEEGRDRQRRGDDEGRPTTTRVPEQRELKLTPGAAYVHMTSNNTIEGTEFQRLPDVGDAPLVSDTSSDMFSRPIDVARHAAHLRRARRRTWARPA